jgi:hypothetical protein
MSRTVFYLFVLSILLIVLGYYAGANQLLKTSIAGLVQLGNTYTGRDSSGKFAGYPGNAPTA